MKKLLVVVMVLGALATNAQNYQPLLSQCSFHHPNSKGYREHFYSEMMKDLDYQKTFLAFVNTALKESGESVNLNHGLPLGKEFIPWMIEHIHFDSVHIGKDETFTNTRKDSHTKKTETYEDFKQKDFMAGTFNYKSCHLTFIKSDCFNFIDLHRSNFIVVTPEEKIPCPTCPPSIRIVEYVYIRDTVEIPGKVKIEYRDRDVERGKVAAETHARNMSGSTSSSSSWSHQSSEEINQVDYSEGPGFTADAAGIFQTVCQIAGITNGSFQSSNVQGRALVSVTPRKDLHIYSNKRSLSGGAASASSTSFSQNQGGNNQNSGNGNNQNYQKTQGVPQPTYNPDPNPFVSNSKKKALAVTADEW